MVTPAAAPPDLLTLLAALFLLLGVPAILFGLIMLYTGYVRYDAEQYLDELEAEEVDPHSPEGDSAGATSAAADSASSEDGSTDDVEANADEEPPSP